LSASAILTMTLPPSGNHSTTVANGRRVLSAKYRAWKEAEVLMLKAQREAKVLGPYAISFKVNRPDRRKRDLGNLEKSLHDAIVEAGYVTDDSLAQKILLEWTRGQSVPVKVFINSTCEV
jgi:crossover junction endodeoxyribonuclease RusA